MIRGQFNIVMGAQAGSESKGKFATYLVDKHKPSVICMASSPNAGHTAIFDGVKYVTYHLPVSWVANRNAVICLGPSSVIYLPTLTKEISQLQIPHDKLMIHPRALMIRNHYMHEEREHGLLKIGSTNQGVGVARREKLMREEDITFAGGIAELQPYIGDTVNYINTSMDHNQTVLCEMTQGFDLDLEHGIDTRYCTSKMINPSMAMAEAGVSPKMLGHIYGVMRPYPIRVNNRDGSSGPYAEAKEITWEEVGIRSGHPDPKSIGEITTTTKLPRRVFEFSHQRMEAFDTICRPDFVCLQFANYIDHHVFGKTSPEGLTKRVAKFRDFLNEKYMFTVAYIGTGPEHHHMIDLGEDWM